MASSYISVTVPRKDLSFFKKLSKSMGWSYVEYNPTDNEAYREAIDDIANGRVYSAQSAEEMMAQILS